MVPFTPVGVPRATLVAATLCVVVLELVTPITLRQVYNTFIPNQSLGSLRVMMVIALVCILAEVFLRMARALILGRVGASYAHKAGCHLMGALLEGRIPNATSQGVAAKLSLINLVRSYRDTGSGMRAITLAEMMLIPLNMTLIGLIAGQLVLVSIALVAGFLIYTTLVGRRLMAAREARQASDGERLDIMVEMLGAMSTVKAMSTERIMIERYSNRKYESAIKNLQVARLQTYVFDLTSTFSTMLILSVIFYGAYMTASADITVGSMIAAIILTGRTMPPLQRAIGMMNRRQEDQLEERKVQAVLEIAPGEALLEPDDFPDNAGALELRDLTLAPRDMAERKDLIVDGVNLIFADRQINLIEGDNNGDTSLLFRTLAGLHTPEGGEVLLNGVRISRLPPEVRSRQIALLQPETVLYRGTIMDNLTRFGQVAVSDVMFIAKHLALDQDLQILSRGYDTMLRGDGGDPVPPGLRQRIALARALAPRPRVVLFDHADTGLDRRSYNALFELFAKLRGHATVILATNDTILSGLAERKFVLQDGRLDQVLGEVRTQHKVQTYRELRI